MWLEIGVLLFLGLIYYLAVTWGVGSQAVITALMIGWVSCAGQQTKSVLFCSLGGAQPLVSVLVM